MKGYGIEGGDYKSLLWEHKKIHTSIMDMWPEAVTGQAGRATPSHHSTTASTTTTTTTKDTDQISSRQTFIRQYDTNLLVVLKILQDHTSGALCVSKQVQPRLKSVILWNVMVKMAPTNWDDVELEIINIQDKKNHNKNILTSITFKCLHLQRTLTYKKKNTLLQRIKK